MCQPRVVWWLPKHKWTKDPVQLLVKTFKKGKKRFASRLTDKNGVTVDLGIENKTVVVLESIQSCPRTRGQGFASAALNELCTLADQFGVTLQLEVMPFGKIALSRAQLREWYTRFGFRPESKNKSPFMQRKPA